MYDELVKRLRCQRFGNCPNCAMWYTEEVEPNLWRERCAAIDAADAIEQLSNAGSAYGRGWTLGYDAGREESKPRWISVEEALPSHGDAVLCVGDNGIGVADFVCGDKWSALPWFFVDGEQETGVTHWMPLPEPPKEET